MRFPNKVISYKESTIGKLDIVLDILLEYEITPLELYKRTKASFEDIGDYIDTLVCLCALNKVSLSTDTGRLIYVI